MHAWVCAWVCERIRLVRIKLPCPKHEGLGSSRRPLQSLCRRVTQQPATAATACFKTPTDQLCHDQAGAAAAAPGRAQLSLHAHACARRTTRALGAVAGPTPPASSGWPAAAHVRATFLAPTSIDISTTMRYTAVLSSIGGGPNHPHPQGVCPSHAASAYCPSPSKRPTPSRATQLRHRIAPPDPQHHPPRMLGSSRTTQHTLGARAQGAGRLRSLVVLHQRGCM